MRTVGYGVIGLGFFGEKHAEAIASLPGAELRALCTRRPERLREVARRLGVSAAYTDYRDLLNDPAIDAVSVATHVSDHAAPTIAALRAGKHVLLEKPMAGSVAECDRIIAAAERADRILMVGHICRFNPRYAVLRERVAAGELGEIVSLYARRNIPAARSRVVLDKIDPLLGDGIHDTDLMLWITGTRIESVYARTHSVRKLKNPDIGWAMYQFAGGAIGVIENVWFLPEGTPFRIHEQMEVIGTAGAAYLHGNDMNLTIHGKSGTQCPDTTYWPRIDGVTTGALRSELDYFMQCVAKGERPTIVTPHEARDAVEVVVAAQKSARSGRAIRP